MTLRVLWGKLRKNNKKDYRQFQFCIVFAMMLVSSYLMMMFSPLVQNSLPDGGDTGKQAYMVFALAVAGCTVFVWYTARLFLRYKSREIGIFLALGAEKGMLSRALFLEMAKMIAVYSLEGIVSGAFLSLIVGQVMAYITAKVNETRFAFTIVGIGTSVLYGIVILMLVLLLVKRAMKRTNIMDVINEQRKQEMIQKMVTKRYLLVGMAFIIVGILGGYFLGPVVLKLTGVLPGAWTNGFYVLAVIGVYQVMVYSISCHERGRNPQKYYNNLLNYGMMKFQGASVVKNMLVIVLLIVGGLYAIYYIPQQMFTAYEQEQAYEDEYSYRYLNDANELTKEQLMELAKKHGIKIRDYREGAFIRVIGDGIERDMDDKGKLLEEHYDNYAEYDCTSASEYERLTGISLKIPRGGYYLIQPENGGENTWYKFDDMTMLHAEHSGENIAMKYLGNTEYSALVITPNNGLSFGSRFVLNDQDYEVLEAELPIERTETQVLFNTSDGEGELAFAAELYKEYALGMSQGMNVMEYYNSQEAIRKGADYADMCEDAIVNPDVPAKETDWQFVPIMMPLRNQQTILGNAIRFMLFIYVAVICFAAVGIIGYTRSQSVGISNAQVFEDIKKLGADKRYRRELMKKQIGKIYVLPTCVGAAVTVIYQFIILWGNDGAILPHEVKTMVLAVGAAVLVMLYQYVMYRKSVKQVGEMLKLGKGEKEIYRKQAEC